MLGEGRRRRGAGRVRDRGRHEVTHEVGSHGLPQQHADLGRVGQQPDRLGATHLLGVAVPRCSQELCQVLDEGVEAGDVRRRGASDQGAVALCVGAAVAAGRDVAALVLLTTSLLVTLRVRRDHGGLDHVLAPSPGKLADHRGRGGIHLVGLLPRQPRGHPRDAPGLPLLDLAGHHPAPQPRVPVPQVERLAERLGAGQGRRPGVDGVLSDTGGRDRRRAVAAGPAADPQAALPRRRRARLLAPAHDLSCTRPLAGIAGALLLADRDVLVGPRHRQQEPTCPQQPPLPVHRSDGVRHRGRVELVGPRVAAARAAALRAQAHPRNPRRLGDRTTTRTCVLL